MSPSIATVASVVALSESNSSRRSHIASALTTGVERVVARNRNLAFTRAEHVGRQRREVLGATGGVVRRDLRVQRRVDLERGARADVVEGPDRRSRVHATTPATAYRAANRFRPRRGPRSGTPTSVAVVAPATAARTRGSGRERRGGTGSRDAPRTAARTPPTIAPRAPRPVATPRRSTGNRASGRTMRVPRTRSRDRRTSDRHHRSVRSHAERARPRLACGRRPRRAPDRRAPLPQRCGAVGPPRWRLPTSRLPCR